METNTTTNTNTQELELVLVALEWEDEQRMIDIITKTTTTRLSLLDLQKKKWKRIDSAPVTLQQDKGWIRVHCDLGYWSVIETEDGTIQADIEDGYDVSEMKSKLKYLGEDVIAIVPVSHPFAGISISPNSIIRELCDPTLLCPDLRPYLRAIKDTQPRKKMELSRDCMDWCSLWLDCDTPAVGSETYTMDDMLRIVDEMEDGMRDDIHSEIYEIMTDASRVVHIG